MGNARKLTLTLPKRLTRRVAAEARALGLSPKKRALQALDGTIAPLENLGKGRMSEGLAALTGFLQRIPGVKAISQSAPSEALWWVKLAIDVNSPIAWHVVQNLGFVLNYISIQEPLPTVFGPVSPPPYLNRGPAECLAWVIEAEIPFLDAGVITDILEERLPRPVENMRAWLGEVQE